MRYAQKRDRKSSFINMTTVLIRLDLAKEHTYVESCISVLCEE